ncbi:MAG: MFS transporter [Mycobacteriales bacterium]
MSHQRSPRHPARDAAPDHLPVAGLLALAMTGFICIATETLPAGLLPQMAAGLSVSPAGAGQLVTAYALGSVLAVIPLTIATAGWPRRHVLLLTILGFLIFNTVTALSSSYLVTLAARFLAGCSAGLAWGLLAAYARRMVEPRQQGRALALAMVGTPIALALGVPLGTWLGSAIGWRSAFYAMSVLALLLIGWVLLAVPNYPGRPSAARPRLAATFVTPGVRPVLAVVLAWMLAHNILYTYISPFAALAGLGGRVDLVLLVFGVAALIGIIITGRLVDRRLRETVLVSIAVFALVLLALGLNASSPLLMVVGVALWGLTFGGAATLLQTALADAAGDGADVALSMNVVSWNLAIAGGGVAGGALLGIWGAASFPWAMLALLLVALVVAWSARRHGFPAGHRDGLAVVTAH